MREFKFRLYRKKFNEMIYDPEILSNDDSISKILESDENFIWMQYTGFIDKNRKEIYEGDILKASNSIVSVIFEHGCFLAGHDFFMQRMFKEVGTEIIGNIYENPELLEMSE